MNIFQCWWKNHGTKILGFFSAAVGTLTLVDESTIKLIESFSPKYGAMISHGILIASGLATAYRGFENSQKLQAMQKSS